MSLDEQRPYLGDRSSDDNNVVLDPILRQNYIEAATRSG